MIRAISTCIFLVSTLFLNAQVKGKVTSATNEILPVVNIFIENTYIGTTTNNDGLYELELEKAGTYTFVFQYLGFKTLKKEVTISSFPFTLNAELEEESVNLNEVVINSKENPAHAIIRAAIAKRKENLKQQNTFTANFYSRGLIKLLNAPEKILGQEVGDLEGNLDSTRQGIIYLSETVSKLEYQYPKDLKETIVASKVSGNNNGFSFNSASDTNFNFYNNTFELGEQIVSPISNNAFSYYDYKLLGGFYEDGFLINKIEIKPKRENDKAFAGIIYIVEDHWSLYGVDVYITGKQTGITPVNTFKLKQSYTFSKSDNIWAKISQTFDFDFKFFGFEGEGKYTVVFSDYNFNPEFEEKNFTRQVLSFEDNANKKDSIYWSLKRQVPLTQEEAIDYVKKDSVELVRNSKQYLDSIDKKNNTFKLGNLLSGYTYKNSAKKWSIGFTSPIEKISFNTVQGWNSDMRFDFTKNIDEYKRFFRVSTAISYGEAEDRLRVRGQIFYKFNSIKRPVLNISGGTKAVQFNGSNPISNLENMISTLYFEDNYMKLFDKTYASLNYSQEVFNGLNLSTGLNYERRKALVNNSDYVTINQSDDIYTSNNPLNESATNTPAFKTHELYSFRLNAKINFAQNYLSYPDGKYNISNSKYPTLYLGYKKGFNGSNTNYNFDEFNATLKQRFNLGATGEINYNLKGGLFNNAENISFIDYKHFNGNQTHIITDGNYINTFKNLPYYGLSTNTNYVEFHSEHNFKGFIMNRIPVLNKLNFNLVTGAKFISSDAYKPYSEFSIGLDNIGFGKYRFLRVDYVRSYQSGFLNDAVMFGISL